MTIDEFVHAEMRKPFIYGETDCCKIFDRWLEHVRGYSPLRRAGYDYTDDAQRRSILERHQNMLFAMLHVADLDGGIVTETPEPGDVGVVHSHGKVWAAILTAKGWFSRDSDGFVLDPRARVIRAWKAHNG
jgi:hypothetical protein